MLLRARIGIYVALVLLAVTTTAAQPSARPHNPTKDAMVVRDFKKLVADYDSLRKDAGGPQNKASNSAAEVEQHRQQVAAKIRAVRQTAKPGDIFTPPIADYFKRQIEVSLNGRSGHRIRKSLERAEPVHNVTVAVDQPYPEGVPLQSTPPSLLLNLPRLPKGLEYRLVDHTLVLLDTVSNLVVDLLPKAIPTP